MYTNFRSNIRIRLQKTYYYMASVNFIVRIAKMRYVVFQVVRSIKFHVKILNLNFTHNMGIHLEKLIPDCMIIQYLQVKGVLPAERRF